MIIVRLQGGLGNQMFQYAAGKELSLRNKTTLAFDLSLLHQQEDPYTPKRNFDLDLFSIHSSFVNQKQLVRFLRLKNPSTRNMLQKISDRITNRFYYTESRPGFDPAVLNLPANTCIEGYFQDERYFPSCVDHLRECFVPKKFPPSTSNGLRQLIKSLSDSHSICVSIRRSDYLNNPRTNAYHGCCHLDYYANSISYIRKKFPLATAYIFSDDYQWCEEKLSSLERVVIVRDDPGDSRYIRKFWLMTLCQHFVISNSSFAWWAAWLGRKPCSVICKPVPWFRASNLHSVDISPNEWVGIPADPN